LAGIALVSGGSVQVVGGVIEATGGWLRPLLQRALPGFSIGAITIGHIVLATDATAMAMCRAHERVHVSQFQRWGFFFPFVYTLASLVALWKRQPIYQGNRYEKEAFEKSRYPRPDDQTQS
jgi:hypothetical protein